LAGLPTHKKLKKSVKNVTKIRWQPCQTNKLAEKLADSSAKVGFLDLTLTASATID
jgi:hypothetical protein